MTEPLCSMKDITSHFGVTSETIRNWIKNKGFPATKCGGRWKFDMEDVSQWVEAIGDPSARARRTKQAENSFKPLLINGDCLECMASIEDSSVDLILTDPPYNLGLFMQNRDTNLKRMRDNYFGAAGWDDMDFAEWTDSMDRFFAESARVLKPGGSMIVFMAVIKVETLIGLAQKNKLYYKTTGTWHKLNPMPRNMNLHFINSTESWLYFTYGARTGTFNNNGKALHDFVETAVTPKSERKYGSHPTQKPESLMRHFVEVLTNPDDTVLDPFMGCGSTGVAATAAGRRFIGIELSEEYFLTSVNRIKEISK